MLEARDRHQKELFDKFRYYDGRLLEINSQKERNLSLKQENRERINQAKEQIYRERMQNKQVKQIVSKVLEEKRSRDREEDMNIKKTKKFQLLYEKNENLSNKIRNLEHHHMTLKHKYGSKLANKTSISDENAEKVKKLE